MRWKLKNSKEVYKNRYMTVTEDEVTTDYGVNVTYGIVHKKEAIAIIPIDGDYAYLIQEYRYAVDFDSWGFPQGHFEHSSILETAKEELKEEAGLSAKTFTEIGRFFLAPGHNTQEYHVFVAKDLKVVPQELEPDELGMKVKRVLITDIVKMIKKGEIKDGPTISCLKLLEIYLHAEL